MFPSVRTETTAAMEITYRMHRRFDVDEQNAYGGTCMNVFIQPMEIRIVVGPNYSYAECLVWMKRFSRLMRCFDHRE